MSSFKELAYSFKVSSAFFKLSFLSCFINFSSKSPFIKFAGLLLFNPCNSSKVNVLYVDCSPTLNDFSFPPAWWFNNIAFESFSIPPDCCKAPPFFPCIFTFFPFCFNIICFKYSVFNCINDSSPYHTSDV